MKHYINSRKLNGEELKDDSPIFANSEKSNTKSQTHLSSKSARQIIFNILQKSGIQRTKKRNRYDKATLYYVDRKTRYYCKNCKTVLNTILTDIVVGEYEQKPEVKEMIQGTQFKKSHLKEIIIF